MGNRRSCGRKVKFRTARGAKFSMRKMQEEGRVLGQCQVYRCSQCGGWHWGRVKGTMLDRAQQIINAIDRAIQKDKENSYDR